ncbi:aspartate-semialdehyde dehydrogenase [Marinobacterium sediminicola]|uniref:Aspartate-semialdehyde dehydrogenase n=2 Tax=Marinobacterium sediminicola TaxID=518898 RepID=A0ABY1RVJ9_9GAMM|nr:aspartate-semialdehyde dehydrogenase [Marinobacterium sediminicola]
MSMNVALIGPNTLKGEKLLELLDESELQVDSLTLYEESDTAGRSLMFRGSACRTKALETFTGEGLALVFVADPELGEETVQVLEAQTSAVVIDLFPQRYSKEPLLVLPAVNGEALASIDAGRIIGVPGSATITAALALLPLHHAYQILKLNLTVLCAASEAGRKGVEALASETAKLLNGREVDSGYFARQIAFNLIPDVGEVLASGYSTLEAQVMHQLPQLLGDEELELEVSAVRVPVFYGDMVVAQAETRQPLKVEELQLLMDKAAGVRFDQGAKKPASLVNDVIGQDVVIVNRIRPDVTGESGFALQALSDDLGRGSALVALEIALALQA